jgi:hypothetical protein
VDIYGPAGSWEHARAAYRGPLPFDGSTVLDVLNRSGVGLCLHREEHREAGIPTLRIFEIACSGAIGICQEHPFIRKSFGDMVLYLDEGLNPEALAAQIDEHMRWIETHHAEAVEMSRRAHAIFERDFTLEVQLREIGRRHQELLAAKGLSKSERPPSRGRVQVIVRAGGRSPAMLARALASIAEQTYPDVSVLVVRHGPVDTGPALAACRGRIEVEVIDLPPAARDRTVSGRGWALPPATSWPTSTTMTSGSRTTWRRSFR